MGCAGASQAHGPVVVYDSRYGYYGSKNNSKQTFKYDSKRRAHSFEHVHGCADFEFRPPVEPKAPFHSRHILIQKLGKGAFARVYAAQRWKKQPLVLGQQEDVAVKITYLYSTKNPNSAPVPMLDLRLRRSCEREAQILKKLSGQRHVIEYIDEYIEGCFSYLVMQKCEMTLLNMLERVGHLSEYTYKRVFSQMLQSLSGIHQHSIVHRDIKPDNYLYTGDPEHGTVKLCDFGLAETITFERPELRDVYGTAPFMSPEMLRGQGYDTKTDVWSFAVICFVLLYGHFPYQPVEKTSKAMKAAIMAGTPEPSFRIKMASLKGLPVPVLSEGANQFARSMLNRDPKVRTYAIEAMRHPWLRDSPRKPTTDTDVPSLRPVLMMAKRVGAFTPPAQESDCQFHDDLAKLQIRQHGVNARLTASSPQDATKEKPLTPQELNANAAQRQYYPKAASVLSNGSTGTPSSSGEKGQNYDMCGRPSAGSNASTCAGMSQVPSTPRTKQAGHKTKAAEAAASAEAVDEEGVAQVLPCGPRRVLRV